jgi:hypothetical protein
MSENVEASTSRNPKGLLGLYRDNFTLPYCSLYVVRRRLYVYSDSPHDNLTGPKHIVN